MYLPILSIPAYVRPFSPSPSLPFLSLSASFFSYFVYVLPSSPARANLAIIGLISFAITKDREDGQAIIALM